MLKAAKAQLYLRKIASACRVVKYNRVLNNMSKLAAKPSVPSLSTSTSSVPKAPSLTSTPATNTAGKISNAASVTGPNTQNYLGGATAAKPQTAPSAPKTPRMPTSGTSTLQSAQPQYPSLPEDEDVRAPIGNFGDYQPQVSPIDITQSPSYQSLQEDPYLAKARQMTDIPLDASRAAIDPSLMASNIGFGPYQNSGTNGNPMQQPVEPLPPDQTAYENTLAQQNSIRYMANTRVNPAPQAASPQQPDIEQLPPDQTAYANTLAQRDEMRRMMDTKVNPTPEEMYGVMNPEDFAYEEYEVVDPVKRDSSKAVATRDPRSGNRGSKNRVAKTRAESYPSTAVTPTKRNGQSQVAESRPSSSASSRSVSTSTPAQTRRQQGLDFMNNMEYGMQKSLVTSLCRYHNRPLPTNQSEFDTTLDAAMRLYYSPGATDFRRKADRAYLRGK